MSEVKRIANLLGVKTLSKAQYDSQVPEVKADTVAKLWHGWDKAISAAGLEMDPLYHEEIPLDALADALLSTFRTLGRIPTLWQLHRRSGRSKNTFTRKFGGYPNFKVTVIKHLLSREDLSAQERMNLTAHLVTLTDKIITQSEPAITPHARGRHLGFRAFPFAPTYEAEVVSLFYSVANDLGFEIIAQRPQFPDCEARRLTDPRRGRYTECLIEFEFRSSGFREHKHPTTGCDLVVCWIHDWKDCPLEVIELQSAIRSLDGWK
ncbi:MAG: hypothetical protein A2107_02880 [Verrucomicrobia bacterium GWF2_62_7]|nr:MAG: hypothetical protein A2107_02880 [Verrucomicrobia bacterium GWF2_62_7]